MNSTSRTELVKSEELKIGDTVIDTDGETTFKVARITKASLKMRHISGKHNYHQSTDGLYWFSRVDDHWEKLM